MTSTSRREDETVSPTFLPGQVLDMQVHGPVLELVSTPLWIYDSHSGCNHWGNSATYKLFGKDKPAFCSSQTELLLKCKPDQRSAWKKLNMQIHEEVEVARKEVVLSLTSADLIPGFFTFPEPKIAMKASFRPVSVMVNGEERSMCIVQVHQQSFSDVDDQQLRLVEVCNNHPMFQFLFDDTGKLLAANKRAASNMEGQFI
jgi:hypothetical protein